MSRNSARIVRCALAVAALGATLGSAHAGDVSVSIGINTPGVYGQINIGGMPAPELLMPQAVVAYPPAVIVGAPPPPPLYLHVPPGYERHWRRHCHEYNACGRPVYFVSENWYRNTYVPHHADRRDERHEHFDRDERHGRDDQHGHEDARDHRDHDDHR